MCKMVNKTETLLDLKWCQYNEPDEYLPAITQTHTDTVIRAIKEM